FKTWRRPSNLEKALNWVIVGGVWAVTVAAPVGLVYKNLPVLRANLGRELSQYAGLVTKSLPPGGAVILCDSLFGQFPFQLYALRAALNDKGAAQNYTLVETSSLLMPVYHRYLNQENPKRWPALPAKINLAEPV